jgi:hypothetical protein
MLQSTPHSLSAAASRTYSNRSNCVAGARAALGDKSAKPGRDFEVYAVGDRLAWRAATASDVVAFAPQPDNDDPGARRMIDMARSIVAEANATAETSAAAGDDGIPAFLARPAPTPEDMRALAAKSQRARERVPSNPPPVAKTTRQALAVLNQHGLKAGTKPAVLVDMVLRPGGATEAEMCKKIGWKKCLVTLRRACAAANVELRGERKDGERKSTWVGTIKSDARRDGKL